MSTADQCRAMGLSVGDVIEGRIDEYRATRLKLLWIGQEVAVFSCQYCVGVDEWTEPHEDANWTLDCREWNKV